MINPLRSGRLSPSEETPPNTFYLTDIKIVKVALCSLAALCASGAGAALAGHIIVPLPLPFPPVIPLIALAVLCVGLARWIRDYKDPIALQKIRDAAKPLSYSQIAQIHGVENMVRYKILPGKIDREDFCTFIEKLPIERLLTLEAEDKKKLNSFKALVKGARVVQNRGDKQQYESFSDCHARGFEDWILKRK